MTNITQPLGDERFTQPKNGTKCQKGKKKVMVVTLVSLSMLYINYCLQQKQPLQQINKIWTKEARQLQLKEAVELA